MDFPVRAELECHHNSRYDTKTKGNAENLQPELEDLTVDRAAGREMHGLKYGEPGRQPDGEGREDDMRRDRERELDARQEQCRNIH